MAAKRKCVSNRACAKLLSPCHVCMVTGSHFNQLRITSIQSFKGYIYMSGMLVIKLPIPLKTVDYSLEKSNS